MDDVSVYTDEYDDVDSIDDWEQVDAQSLAYPFS